MRRTKCRVEDFQYLFRRERDVDEQPALATKLANSPTPSPEILVADFVTHLLRQAKQ